MQLSLSYRDWPIADKRRHAEDVRNRISLMQCRCVRCLDAARDAERERVQRIVANWARRAA